MSHKISLPYITSASPSSDYTISTYTGEEEIFLLTPSANITVNLPAAANVEAGYKYQIKNLSASYTLTIDGNASEEIDKSTTFVLGSQFDSVTIFSNGLNEWFII